MKPEVGQVWSDDGCLFIITEVGDGYVLYRFFEKESTGQHRLNFDSFDEKYKFKLHKAYNSPLYKVINKND